MKSERQWDIKVSHYAQNTINPIRQVLENLNASPNPNKKLIPLSIGDPTVFGNLEPNNVIIEAMVESIQSNKFNGYLPSNGIESARKAIAEYSSTNNVQVDPKDVIITSGCSHALEMAINVLAEPGKNILLPRPGFPLYQTLCGGLGIGMKYYNLDAEKNWEIDLDHLEAQIDPSTVAIVYNNPSNPCGSVYSASHIRSFLEICEKHKVPVIADEIYEHLVFPGHKFTPIASLTQEVPILSCRGTTKRFMVPGYRCGWIIIHDKQERFGNPIRKGLNNLTHRIVGANSIVQGALPKILKEIPDEYFQDCISLIHANAKICYSITKRIPGLTPIMPTGAMYIMVGIDTSYFPELSSDLHFVERLMSEESIFVLPGKMFGVNGYIRIVLTVPSELLIEACNRLENFCLRNVILPSNQQQNGQPPTTPAKPLPLPLNLRESVKVD
ncbi:tyrosine aminotransferase [Tetranychus urticae]|uniref:Tyrosine aminotransferase n=1 Tax=Tetranychus urticae TaxID=32264 RepID=T1KD99_TETUR|nr:tyrosine aminotransferase [Tetranychus urticae]